MLSTSVPCRRLIEVPLRELVGMDGIFVIWDAKWRDRPRYVATGDQIRRLSHYFRRTSETLWPRIDGHVGIVGPEKDESADIYTRAIKRLVLDVATDIGRFPRVTSHSSATKLLEVLQQYGSYRVSFGGHDPLAPPSSVVPLEAARTIVAWTLDREDYWIEHTKMIPASLYRSLE